MSEIPEIPEINLSWFRADNAWILQVSINDRSSEDIIADYRKYGASIAVIDR